MIEQYAAPISIEEATRVMQESNATVLAGGTDLMLQTESGKQQFGSTLVNIRHINEISGISIGNDRIRIGALTTISEILGSDKLIERVPVLAQTADHFASSQIRNSATVGGNLCNASPAGDMIIPLLLLDAEAELASWSKGGVVTRLLPIAEFFSGPGKTHKRDDELLVAIEFPVPSFGFIAYFKKSGPRPALEISTISIGVAGTLEKEALHATRMAIGAAAPTPLRARRVEALLEGKPLRSALISEAADVAANETLPIDDVRASAWYRKHLIRVFTTRLLNDVIASSD